MKLHHLLRFWRFDMSDKTIKIKKRAEESRVISLRVKEVLLSEIDEIAAETNCSRNEIINILLEHGVRNVEIEK